MVESLASVVSEEKFSNRKDLPQYLNAWLQLDTCSKTLYTTSPLGKNSLFQQAVKTNSIEVIPD